MELALLQTIKRNVPPDKYIAVLDALVAYKKGVQSEEHTKFIIVYHLKEYTDLCGLFFQIISNCTCFRPDVVVPRVPSKPTRPGFSSRPKKSNSITFPVSQEIISQQGVISPEGILLPPGFDYQRNSSHDVLLQKVEKPLKRKSSDSLPTPIHKKEDKIYKPKALKASDICFHVSF